ncbi:hypothetical protein [Leisingera sp. S232]|uniref:hypothetical protein n=1 Tax=Leisingera sp. S232 TaxID=3415132 RepID=UPI003C7D99AC
MQDDRRRRRSLVLAVIQTSYLTRPMAPAIFHLRSIAPKDMTYGPIYRRVLPLMAAQGPVPAAFLLVPELATWLPSLLVGLLVGL